MLYKDKLMCLWNGSETTTSKEQGASIKAKSLTYGQSGTLFFFILYSFIKGVGKILHISSFFFFFLNPHPTSPGNILAK